MRPRHLLYILLLLPVFIARDYTPSNELKYVSIVDEALDNNTWFAFYNHGEVYADKPPLFIWLMMLGKLVTGRHLIWLMGLFALIPAAGIMAVCDRWMRRAGIAHDAVASNFMLGTSIMFLGAAAVVRMDMLMAFFIVLSLYTFYKLYTGQGKKRDRWLLPLWIFMAVFSKGPVGLFVPVLSITVFLVVKRDIRCFGKYLGWRQWAIMLGLSAVWFSLVYLEGGNEYLNNLLVKQTVGRGVDAFHHKEPVWFYLTNSLWMLAPWTVLYVAAFWAGSKQKVLQGDFQTLFLCIIASTFVMLSAFSSKVQVYLLPIFPFVAYLASAYIYKLQENKWIRAGAAIPAVILIPAFPASFFAGRFIPYEYENLLPFHIAFLLLSTGAAVALYYIARKMVSRGVAVLSLSILVTLTVASTGLGQFNRYLGFRVMAEKGMETAEMAGAENYAFFRFYRAENMDAYIGKKLLKIEEVVQVDSLINNSAPTVLFVRDKELERIGGLKEALANQQLAGELYQYQWYVLGGVAAATPDDTTSQDN